MARLAPPFSHGRDHEFGLCSCFAPTQSTLVHECVFLVSAPILPGFWPADAINMSVIARASIQYGWKWSNDTCEASLISAGERYAQAVSLAGTLLLGYIKATSGSGTTVEEDRQCLMSVETCSVGEESGAADGEEEGDDAQNQCDAEALVRDGVPKYDVIMALKYRMSRKRVLQEAIDRLTDSCSISPDMISDD